MLQHSQQLTSSLLVAIITSFTKLRLKPKYTVIIHFIKCCLHVFFFFHWEWHSGITHHYRWLQMIDWMIECVLETRVLALSGDNPAAVVKRIAVLLSCDEAKSPGTDGGPCLSISVTVVWVFLPSGPVTHSSTAHWHRLPGPPCHKHVHPIWGLMSTSLEHHRGSAVRPSPPYPALRLPAHLPWL